MIGSSTLWHSPKIKTLDEIEWERKETRKRRFRRLGVTFLYTLIILSLLIG